MQPLKLLACLVTLQFTCGLTLQAADPQAFRQWTDVNGRTIMARLVAAPGPDSVKIERQDGRFFTVALKTFSTADQEYVNAYRAENAPAEPAQVAAGSEAASALDAAMKDPTPANWELLNSGGSQPASTYSNTRLEQIIEVINQRCAVKEVKTPSGRPLQIRTEPTDLASRIKISGDMPRMSTDSFVREVARVNDLKIKIDPAGMLVLVDKTQPAPKSSVSFLGVASKPN
ncbi:MAG TPA: hypothetical protein VIO38_09360 [Rariglobus sp.]|jgi:hypothetical protein